MLSKNGTGTVFATDLLAKMYPDATFIALIRNGLAICEGFTRRGEYSAADSGSVLAQQGTYFRKRVSPRWDQHHHEPAGSRGHCHHGVVRERAYRRSGILTSFRRSDRVRQPALARDPRRDRGLRKNHTDQPPVHLPDPVRGGPHLRLQLSDYFPEGPANPLRTGWR